MVVAPPPATPVVVVVVTSVPAVVAVAAGVPVPATVVSVTDGVSVPVGGAVGGVTFPLGRVHPAARTPALTTRSATRRIMLGLMRETMPYAIFISYPLWPGPADRR